jgi:hypothetical protein
VVLESLVRDHPEHLDFAVTLSWFCLRLGNLDVDERKTQAALDHYSLAIRVLGALPLPKSRQVEPGRSLRDLIVARAELLVHLGRDEEAVKDWERAIELDEGVSRDWLQVRHAYSLVRLGEHVRATAEASEAFERVRESGGALYFVSCVFSLASAAVAKDGTLPQQVERSRLADEHAARAVAILLKARDAGCFKDPAKIALLKQDTDLDPLRARTDFIKLVAEVEGQAESKAQAK